MRVLTNEEVQAAETQALERSGMSRLVLIQRAGHAVAQFCAFHFKFRSVCVVCGAGTNGARGLAAAESLSQIAENVSVILLANSTDRLHPDIATCSSRLNQEPLRVSADADFQTANVREALQADLIIDAIADDRTAPLTSLQRCAVEALNDAFGTVVAIDLPSGVSPDSRALLHQAEHDTVFAHGIITFVAPRPAHVFGELTTGPIAISELGVQPAFVENKMDLQVVTGQEIAMAFPPRLPDAHKGNLGHVLVIGALAGKEGAAALAAMAALRSGAGLVTVACPESTRTTVAGFAPEMMTEALPETDTHSIASRAIEVAERLMTDKDSVVLGPGLGRHPDTASFVRGVVAHCKLPLVLDSDAIDAFAGGAAELKNLHSGNFLVLAPEAAQAAKLLNIPAEEVQAERIDTARRLARDTGTCIVLKGWRTVVAGASGETWIDMSGNATLGKSGSNDVLSGIIGAALARHSGEPRHQNELGGEPELQPARTRVHEFSEGDAKARMRELRAGQLARDTRKSTAFLNDVKVAAAVHLYGMAADMARDDLHENTVIARDVMENFSAAFHHCETEMESGLFYLQR